MNGWRLYLRDARERIQAQRRRDELARRFPSARIDPSVEIVSPQRLELGSGVLLQRGVFLHCGGLSWSAGEGAIRVGAGSSVAAYNVWFGAGGIDVGERLDAGPGVMIFSSQTEYRLPRSGAGREHRFGRVEIGDDVILYAGCIVTPGVRIGSGAAIAAGAVVTDDVPSAGLYGGVPARRIRDLEPSGPPQ